jgi:hypothetical protein
MLLTQTVDLIWTKKNKKRYLSKNYIFTKIGDTFSVSVFDLPNNSTITVKAKCDYCGEETPPDFTYGQYYRQALSSPVKTYACNNPECNFKKRFDMAKYRQQRGDLDEKNPFYFHFEENVMKRLEDYLLIYENLSQIRNKPEGIRLLNIFQRHKEFDMIEMAKKLGYDEEKLNFNPVLGLSREEMNSEDRRNEQFEEVKAIILEFMNNNNNRFPTCEEFCVLPGMNNSKLDKFGGIHEIRKKMGITDPVFLIDDRGWPNKSSYEYTVAQFLIHNNVPYIRDQKPFKESLHKSDFTFYPKEGQVIHLELWGFDESSSGSVAEDYVATKAKKVELYNKYSKSIQLVSLERSIFKRTPYDHQQAELNRILEPILKMKLKKVEQEVIIPPTMLSKEQLFKEFLKYTDDNTTPLYFNLPNNLRDAISIHYKNYEDFLKQNNFQPNKESTHVPVESLFDAIEELIKEEGSSWNLKSYLQKNKDRFKGYISKVRKNRGVFDVKLRYFGYCVEKGIPIVETDQMYLIGVAQKKITNITRQNEEQTMFAIEILKKLGVHYETIHFQHFNLKLKDEEVRKIRILRKNGTKIEELIEKFQVGKSTINEALNGSTYSHIK